MNIRYAKIEDMKYIAKIKVDSWKTAYKGIIDEEYLKSLDYEKNQKKYEERIDKGFWVVYESDDNEILGFCWFDDRYNSELEIDSQYDSELIAIYVRQDYKHQGIGKAMFQFVTDELIKKNKIKMILWVLEDNKSSIEFYKKMGGRLVSKKEQIIGDKPYFLISFGYELKNKN